MVRWAAWFCFLLLMVPCTPEQQGASCSRNAFIADFAIVGPAANETVRSRYYVQLMVDLLVSTEEFSRQQDDFTICLKASDSSRNVHYEECGLSGFDQLSVPARGIGANNLQVRVMHRDAVELCSASLTVQCCDVDARIDKPVQTAIDERAWQQVLGDPKIHDGPVPTQRLVTSIPAEECSRVLRVVIGVKSAATNVLKRNIIRSTWMKSLNDASRLTLQRTSLCVEIVSYFLVGTRSDAAEKLNEALRSEQRRYGDTLLHKELPVEDSYNNLPQKVLKFLQWIHQCCKTLSQRIADFVVICDDDVYIEAHQLILLLMQTAHQYGDSRFHFYAGEVLEHRMHHVYKPQRDPLHRNYLSKAQYPMEVLPPFALGNFYVLSRPLVEYLATNADILQPTGTLEDLSIGMWLMGLQVFATHLSGVCDISRCLFEPALYQTSHRNENASRILAVAGLHEEADFLLLHAVLPLGHKLVGTSNEDSELMLAAVKWSIKEVQDALYENRLPDLAAGAQLVDDLQKQLERQVADAEVRDINLVLGLQSLYLEPFMQHILHWAAPYNRVSDVYLLSSVSVESYYRESDSEGAFVDQCSTGEAKCRQESFLYEWSPDRKSMWKVDLASVANKLRHHVTVLVLSVLDCATLRSEDNALEWTLQSQRILDSAVRYVQPTITMLVSGEAIDLSQLKAEAVDIVMLSTTAPALYPTGSTPGAGKYFHVPNFITAVAEMEVEHESFGFDDAIAASSNAAAALLRHSAAANISSEYDAKVTDISKTRGIAYLYKRCDRAVRELFFDLLSIRLSTMNQLDQLSALGVCHGSAPSAQHSISRVEDSRFSGRYLHRAIELYQPFRFVIAFENTVAAGYITEKLVNAYLADAVPIYWGAPDVANYFNKDSMIHCNPPDALHKTEQQLLEECVELVLQIMRNETRYQQLTAAPVLRGDTNSESFQLWSNMFPWHAIADSYATSPLLRRYRQALKMI